MRMRMLEDVMGTPNLQLIARATVAITGANAT